MDYKGLFHLMSRLHVAATSNEITLVGYHMKSGLLATGIMSELRRIMDYEGLFHLMLRLHVASTSNEITFVGNHMNSDLLPTGSMSELQQPNNNCDVTISGIMS